MTSWHAASARLQTLCVNCMVPVAKVEQPWQYLARIPAGQGHNSGAASQQALGLSRSL